jgi:hypothetical protein
MRKLWKGYYHHQLVILKGLASQHTLNTFKTKGRRFGHPSEDDDSLCGE